MSGCWWFCTAVWIWLSKSFQFTVFTLTVIFGFALWKASAMPCQYFMLVLAGPVP